MPSLDGVPTLHEAGIDGVDVTQWYALFAPAGTLDAVVATISRALHHVLGDTRSVREIEAHDVTVTAGSPEQLGTLVRRERARWADVVRHARLHPVPVGMPAAR